MARSIPTLKKSFIFNSSSSSSSSSQIFKILGSRPNQQPPLNPNLSPQSPRTYTSQKKVSETDQDLLRIIRREIQYETNRIPVDAPPTEYNSYKVDGRSGEAFVTLERQFGENPKEYIKIEATMFDGSKHLSKLRLDDALRRHISVVVTINKRGRDDSFEILCSAWKKCLRIDQLGTRKLSHTQSKSYFSPTFKDLDDKLIESLYMFLKYRGIDDKLAVFLHNYIKNKEQTEFIKWMETMKCIVEKK